ncbi:hypothetical protein [Methylomonas sp. AM2-LC]|uniref:hypothetical protein n=1 Tax=Methylomonas sp. AM2-LC TaxID=3153301 RepID=UPI00326477B8
MDKKQLSERDICRKFITPLRRCAYEKIRAIREVTQERIEELLNDEQLTKWDT